MTGFGRKSADLDANVAVAPFFLQFVVGEILHFLQMLGLFATQPETCVKQARTDGYGNGQTIGRDGFAQQAAAGRGQLFVAVHQFSAFGQKFDAGGQGAEIVDELGNIGNGNIEGAEDAEGLVRRGNAGLMYAVAVVGSLAVAAVAGAVGGGFTLGR